MPKLDVLKVLAEEADARVLELHKENAERTGAYNNANAAVAKEHETFGYVQDRLNGVRAQIAKEFDAGATSAQERDEASRELEAEVASAKDEHGKKLTELQQAVQDAMSVLNTNVRPQLRIAQGQQAFARKRFAASGGDLATLGQKTAEVVLPAPATTPESAAPPS